MTHTPWFDAVAQPPVRDGWYEVRNRAWPDSSPPIRRLWIGQRRVWAQFASDLWAHRARPGQVWRGLAAEQV